jgi:electron transfer flavoprotein alpha subunit
MQTPRGVLVFLEQSGGVTEDVSFEVLGKGREIADGLGAELTGLMLGNGLKEAAEDCARRGADTILCIESPELADFTVEPYVDLIAPVIEERHPEVVLIGATHNGTALAASLAIRLKVGLIAHVVDLELDASTKKLVGSVPGFGGSIVALCKCKKDPQIATVRPGVFKPAVRNEAKAGDVVQMGVGPRVPTVKCKVLETHVGKTVEVGRAARVVVAGLGCKDDLQTPKKLAEAMSGVLAVTRPLADKGLASKDLVVGSSGAALSAKVAIAVGVSGAAHFISGVRDVQTVIAVNSDPKAQIFQQADYCVVADAGKLLPKLVSELSARGGDQTK